MMKKNRFLFGTAAGVFALALAFSVILAGCPSDSDDGGGGGGGLTWTKATGDNTYTTTFYVDLNDAAYGNGKFVAVGYNGTIVYSSDGTIWIEVPVGNGSSHFNGVAYGGGRFVVVGESAIAYSNVLE